MSKVKTKPFAVVLVKTGDDYYVQIDDDEKVVGFDSVGQGVASLENAYNRNHGRGYEGSMSACINYIFFNRAVVGLKSVADLRKKLLPDVPDAELERASLGHVSGFMSGIKADREKAAKVWETAAHPRLIS